VLDPDASGPKPLAQRLHQRDVVHDQLRGDATVEEQLDKHVAVDGPPPAEATVARMSRRSHRSKGERDHVRGQQLVDDRLHHAQHTVEAPRECGGLVIETMPTVGRWRHPTSVHAGTRLLA